MVRFSPNMDRSKKKEDVICAKDLILASENKKYFLSIDVWIAFHKICLSDVLQMTCVVY